jgi:hypothetical protein
MIYAGYNDISQKIKQIKITMAENESLNTTPYLFFYHFLCTYSPSDEILVPKPAYY